MKKRAINILATGFLTCALTANMSLNTYARNYNCTYAQTYAEKYALSPNIDCYYTFRSDCTNFASQVAHAGGVPMRVNKDFQYNALAADIDRDYNNNFWYSDRHNATLTVLSHTWDGVDEFRKYMKDKRQADVYTYRQTNADWDKLMQKVWIGDVVQCGDEHSIIIQDVVTKDRSGIKYAAHSINAKNKSLSRFITWCQEDRPNDPIYVIHFK